MDPKLVHLVIQVVVEGLSFSYYLVELVQKLLK